MEIKVKAPAKINLTLEVLGKRPDGYHNISTVMQAVDLYDVITITDNDSGKVTISCNYEGVPCDDSLTTAKWTSGAFISISTRRFPHRRDLRAAAVTALR